MGMKEVIYDAVHAFCINNPVELVSSAVGALDRFLLGMVCLVFGLGCSSCSSRGATARVRFATED